MEHESFNLKISYIQRLDIQLFIRQRLDDQKFRRYWIITKGFGFHQELALLKCVVGFFNQGDLYQIRSDHLAMKWRQKTLQQNFNITLDKISQKYREPQYVNLQPQIYSIDQAIRKESYDQLCVLTLFLSENLQKQQFNEIFTFIKQSKQKKYLVNFFVPQQYILKFTFDKTWIRSYSTNWLKNELRGFFTQINRITYKKISVNFKCLQGDILLTEKNENPQKIHWMSQENYISYEIHYPTSHRPYIMQIEMKSFLKNQLCVFLIQLICQDDSNNISKCTKTFSLKPKRNFVDWTLDANTQKLFKTYNKNQQISLNFEDVNLNQKLNFMKIYGTPARIIIKEKQQV